MLRPSDTFTVSTYPKPELSEDEIAEVTEEDRMDDDFVAMHSVSIGSDCRTDAAKEIWSLYEGACTAVEKDAICSLLWLNDGGTVNRENLPRLIREQEARCAPKRKAKSAHQDVPGKDVSGVERG